MAYAAKETMRDRRDCFEKRVKDTFLSLFLLFVLVFLFSLFFFHVQFEGVIFI